MLKLVDNLGQNTYWTWIFKEILTEREKEKENEKEREKKGEEVGEGTKHMLERIKKNKETYKNYEARIEKMREKYSKGIKWEDRQE